MLPAASSDPGGAPPAPSTPYRLCLGADGRFFCHPDAADPTLPSPLPAAHSEDPTWTEIARHATPGDDLSLLRFLYDGLIFPKNDSLMLRCRMSGCELSATQVSGLATLAREYGGGYADITTRGNLQIRDIAPRHGLHALREMLRLGIVPPVPGVNNLRNVTSSPATGFDPSEVLDVLPIAREISRALIYHPALHGLPGKFNIAVDSGGLIGVSADTNDLGFYAVNDARGPSFRLRIAGGNGLHETAADAGLRIAPDQVVAVAAALVRTFLEHADLSQRLRARMKFFAAEVGLAQILAWTQEKLAFTLEKSPAPPPFDKAHDRAHYGCHRQLGVAKNYLGLVVPAGRLSAVQWENVAHIAHEFGEGVVRLTVRQNCLIPGIKDSDLDEVLTLLRQAGITIRPSSLAGGMVACTGSRGCSYSATDTKSHSREVAAYLDERLVLDQAINIHFTGCSFSCAQPYIGDIGLLGLRLKKKGENTAAYHLSVGGGPDGAGAGRRLFSRVPYAELAPLLAGIISTYLERRDAEESFASFTKARDIETLRALFTPKGGCRA
ncbi:MAG: precorrin-3B synthase [Verrucomicrobiales bacterium]